MGVVNRMPHPKEGHMTNLFRIDRFGELLELALSKQFVGGVTEEDSQLAQDRLPLPTKSAHLLLGEFPRNRGRGHRELLQFHL